MTGTVQIALDKIKIDGGTQSRAELNDDVVADYAATIRDGGDFPPVVVFFDGKKHWLADGFHRFHAYKAAGAVEIAADIRQGTRRDAILFSVGANASHGLRRTNDDKRRAVLTLLNDDEWGKWSDREIARRCGVSDRLVNALRGDTANNSQSDTRTFIHPKTGKPAQMETGAIGKAKAPDTSEAEAAAQRELQDQLPQAIKDQEAARAQAIADKKSAPSSVAADLSPDQRITELEEHVAVLEAENASLKAENEKFGPMKVLFDQGGFEAVIEARDEEIRVLKTRVERESGEKVSYLRSRDYWRKQAERLGFNDDIVIDMETGEEVHG